MQNGCTATIVRSEVKCCSNFADAEQIKSFVWEASYCNWWKPGLEPTGSYLHMESQQLIISSTTASNPDKQTQQMNTNYTVLVTSGVGCSIKLML